MKSLITFGITLFILLFAFGGMAYGEISYPWGEGSANVNTASEEELEWFLGRSGVDDPEQIAENIVTYREANGPFTSSNELVNIEGISDDNIDKMRLWLKTTGPTDFEAEKTVHPHLDPFLGYWAEEYRSD